MQLARSKSPCFRPRGGTVTASRTTVTAISLAVVFAIRYESPSGFRNTAKPQQRPALGDGRVLGLSHPWPAILVERSDFVALSRASPPQSTDNARPASLACRETVCLQT